MKTEKWQTECCAKWIENGVVNLSVVFSWHLAEALEEARLYREAGYEVKVGGPATLERYDYPGPERITYHNPEAVFTSRGCVRRCEFCSVPKTEGDLIELKDWEPRRLICDNNLLACSEVHFNRVIDRLLPLDDVDFNQGLDARLVTPAKATRLRELRLKCLRLSWDFVGMESAFMDAFNTLRAAGFPKSKFRVYVLIGFRDTPEDALYRLQTVRKLGMYPFPMRYQPLDAQIKNEHVAPGWTDEELKRYMRYWANTRIVGKLPFAEFDYLAWRKSARAAARVKRGLS